MYFTGVIIAVSTFLIIGIFHPIVIKTEYYTGTRLWWVFLVLGLASVAAALFIENVIVPLVDRRIVRPAQTGAEGLVPHEPQAQT